MRIRISFAKTGNLRYTSILDVQKVWERAARRANLGLQYSQGFHPQAKIQVANPLPLGFTGKKELVDLWISDDYPKNDIQKSLQTALPQGIDINNVEILPENAPSLPKQVEYSDYSIHLHASAPDFTKISALAAGLLEKETLPRVRNSKPYDLRPLILSLEVIELPGGSIQMHLRMPSNPGKTGRPEEVLFEMGFEWPDFEVERSALSLTEQPA